MKEKIIMLSLTFLAFFVGFRNIDAASMRYGLSCGELITNSSNQTAYKNCSLNIEVRDTPIKFNQFNVKFNLDNMGIKNLKMQTNWYTNTTTGADFVFETSLDTLAVGKHTIATFEAHKVSYSDPCNISAAMTFSTVKRNCSTFQGNYYDKNGNIVSEIDYLDSCFPHTCTILTSGSTKYYYNKAGNKVTQTEYEKDCFSCKIENNKYYNKNGQEVSKIEYERDCLFHKTCSILTDGTTSYYYDSKGNEVTQTAYEKDCFSCKADVANNKYYNKNGKEVSKFEYQKDCLPINCTILTDGSVKHYYNNSGQEVDQVTYEKECLNVDYTCKYHDGKYYDKNGNETTEVEYQRQCLSHKCEILINGSNKYYYDSRGNEVSESVYQKDCFSCKVDSNKYYNKDGNEVTKIEYEKECLPHKCEVLTDGSSKYYYDSKGNEVNESVYQKDCFSCKVDNNKYYNKDGKEVSKIDYQRDCLEKSCSVLTDGDKSYYYDSKGKEVSKDEFEADCTKEEHICTIVDDKYFDHNGKEISEKEFNILCSPHSCEIIDDTHFDKDGNVVDKKQYELSCGHNEENPKTGVVVPIVSLVTLSVLGGFFWIKSKKTNLFD